MDFLSSDSAALGGKPSGAASPGVAILVLGDEPVVNGLARSGFGGKPVLIEAASSPELAEQLRQRFRFDLVILDADLPGEPTLDWVAAMRRRGDRVPAIALTSAVDADAAILMMRAGVSDLLAKPVDEGLLVESIGHCLGQVSGQLPEVTPSRISDEIFEGEGIVGESAAMNNLCRIIKRLGPTPATVLIEGESGTGKELVARAIHRLSGRKGPFAAINCGAITPELFESELFGHTKGAFTGAHQTRDGLFSYAEKGTVFLDEIAEMPLLMQAKLLRVLEQRTIRPVGANREVSVDVRMIAATNRDLASEVSRGAFREDLFHRLNVLALRVPPLRERPDDIPALADYFLQGYSAKLGMSVPRISDSEWLRLRRHSWPGNVRELRNMIERCVLLNQRPVVRLGSDAIAAEGEVASDPDDLSLAAVERGHIQAVLELAKGNKSEAARRLGISRKTLERKLRKWEEAQSEGF